MTANRILFAVVALLAMTAARAHHSFAAEFLEDQTGTIEGTITEVWFKNPHVRYYVEVETEDGGTETWDIRSGSRRGWCRCSSRLIRRPATYCTARSPKPGKG